MSTVFALRHVPFEDLGTFADVFVTAGYGIRYLEGGLDPAQDLHLSTGDVAVILGGPIGVHDVSDYPYVADELMFIERCLRERIPTMGVCLGAQMVAHALGARVYPAAAKEIGFAPITVTDDGRTFCLAPFADGTPVLHWHGETFDLPAGSRLLASTEICPNQAFAYGERCLGVQFHMEASARNFEQWLIGHTVELHTAGLSVNALRAGGRRHFAQLEKAGRRALSAWLDGVRNAP